jgi:hypothetical protein
MKRFIPLFLAVALLLPGCTNSTSHAKAVYMLMDTSGTYAKNLHNAQAIINYLLGTLNPGDSLAVAQIDTGSFSEKNIIDKVTFDGRPSLCNAQKRAFREKVDHFVGHVKGSAYTDISGGVLQAVEFLKETHAGSQTILIYSDLKQDLKPGYVRNFPIKMKGIHVVALNVTKLRQDNVDPRKYMKRLAWWKHKVTSGGGTWKVLNDLDRPGRILAN